MARVRIYPGAIKLLIRSAPLQRDLDRRARNVERHQKTHVAVDTGRLKADIHIERVGDGRRIGSSLKYAIFLELGTRRMRAQPFVRPSVDAARL
jgi:HK97 gp10 family phage protein